MGLLTLDFITFNLEFKRDFKKRTRSSVSLLPTAFTIITTPDLPDCFSRFCFYYPLYMISFGQDWTLFFENKQQIFCHHHSLLFVSLNWLFFIMYEIQKFYKYVQYWLGVDFWHEALLWINSILYVPLILYQYWLSFMHFLNTNLWRQELSQRLMENTKCYPVSGNIYWNWISFKILI